MSDYSSIRSAHLLRGPHENVMGRKHMTHREAILMVICPLQFSLG